MAADNFNRSDGALGSNWTGITSFSGMEIVSNEARTGEGGYKFAFWNAEGFGDDQYSEAVARNGTNAESGVIVRAIAEDKCYFFDFSTNSGNAFLFVLDGSFTLLQSFGAVASVGDLLKIEAIGNAIKCYVNGVQVGTTTNDSTLASGSPGIGGARGIEDGAVDDWVGETIGAGGQPTRKRFGGMAYKNRRTPGRRQY